MFTYLLTYFLTSLLPYFLTSYFLLPTSYFLLVRRVRISKPVCTSLLWWIHRPNHMRRLSLTFIVDTLY